MKISRTIFALPFKYWYVSSFLVGTGILLNIQLGWWVDKNGWVLNGTCVNHFGEAYNCHVFDWIARIGSPFAIPVVLFVFAGVAIAFGLPRLVWVLIRKSKRAA